MSVGHSCDSLLLVVHVNVTVGEVSFFSDDSMHGDKKMKQYLNQTCTNWAQIAVMSLPAGSNCYNRLLVIAIQIWKNDKAEAGCVETVTPSSQVVECMVVESLI